MEDQTKPSFAKEGIQAAVDFVKYILTLAGGAIALCVQPTFYEKSLMIKVLSSFSFLFLCVCIVSGLFVHARGCILLQKSLYDLDDPYLKVPGMVMQFAFLIGFAFLGVAVAVKAWA